MTFMQKIMAGIVLPLAFCLVGGFFASQGFDYFKTKEIRSIDVYHKQMARLFV